MKLIIRLFFILAVFVGFTGISQAYVDVNPRIYDFGNVRAQTSRTITVTFRNNGPLPLNSFRTFCSGSLSVFMCSSSCFQLPAWGSCSVQVQFSPRSGDGQMHWLNVEGSGSGSFVSSRIQGTDAR